LYANFISRSVWGLNAVALHLIPDAGAGKTQPADRLPGQPLQILLTGIEYLSRHPSSGPSHDLEEEMLRATRNLKSIIHRIQNFTRYKTEEYVLGKRIVDLDQSSSR